MARRRERPHRPRLVLRLPQQRDRLARLLYVAPMSWAVRYDVEAGRDKLNFSTWDRDDGEADDAPRPCGARARCRSTATR